MKTYQTHMKEFEYVLNTKNHKSLNKKQRKLSMKNEIHVTNFEKEMTYFLKLGKLNIQTS